MKRFLRSTWVVLLSSFLIGFLFHSIRGVSDPRDLWVGNLSWPYVLVPAIACAGQRSLRSAFMRGVGSSLLMVLGFYNVLGLFTVSAMEIGVDPGTPRIAVVATAWQQYLMHLVLGLPGGVPWITVSILSGGILVIVARLATRVGAGFMFWTGVGLVGVLEPVFHFAPFFASLPLAGYRFNSAGRAIAATECVLGFALLAVVGVQGHALSRASRATVR